MAEILGIVIGTLGVSGSFSVALEIIDRISDAKAYDKKYLLFASQLQVERRRLVSWGAQIGSGYEDPLVMQILQQIVELLKQADKLKDQYGLIADVVTTEVAVIGAQTDAKRRWKKASVGIKIRWSLKGKKKTSEMAADLKAMVDNLYELQQCFQPTISPATPENQRNHGESSATGSLQTVHASNFGDLRQQHIRQIDAAPQNLQILGTVPDFEQTQIHLGGAIISLNHPSNIGTANSLRLSHVSRRGIQACVLFWAAPGFIDTAPFPSPRQEFQGAGIPHEADQNTEKHHHPHGRNLRYRNRHPRSFWNPYGSSRNQ